MPDERPERPRRRAPRIVLLCFSIVLSITASLALLEGGARIVEMLRARDAGGETVRIDDPVLEYRIAPHSGGHDGRGFRNAETLTRADIVALGDSQTWGENAEMDESWPARLAAKSGLSVYNMGRGGYGPLQYLALIDTALELEPRFLVVALYFGNDFFDAYDMAYGSEAHASWRHPDARERARIANAPYPDLKRMLFERVGYRSEGLDFFAWIREQTAIGRLTSRAIARVDPAKDRAWAEDHPEDGFVYDGAGLSTVFHTSYRLAAVDTRLARIEEGVRITEAALVALAGRVREAPATKLYVVLLPTKERIFEAAIAERASTSVPESYRESVAFERLLAKRLERWMTKHEIAWVDTLPALEAAVLAGEAIFPPNGDGHFTSAGYARVAEVVARKLSATP